MAMLGMEYDRNVWKRNFLRESSQPKNVKYANGSVGARGRLMVIGGCVCVWDQRNRDTCVF